MKLRTKILFLFNIALFFTIGLISYFLIKTTFNEILEQTIQSSLSEYTRCYYDITDSRHLKSLFLTNQEVIELKAKNYLANQTQDYVSIEFRNEQNNIVFQSDMFPKEIKLNLYPLEDKKLKYEMIKSDDKYYLMINSLLLLNGTKYEFIYSEDISRLFIMKYQNYLTIAKINVIVMLLMMVFLYYFTCEITEPIKLLIDKINDIIKHKYHKKLFYKSDILEFQEIASNFNTMTDEIQYQIFNLQKQNDQKQRFIENLTHEIRTPLTSIIGYSSLMLKKEVQDSHLIKQSFDIIHQNGERILGLTTELIKMIDVKETNLMIETISLQESLAEVIQSFSLQIKENHIEVQIQGKDNNLETDKGLFTILISNLIDNCIKALKTTSTKQILLTMEQDHLIIKDSGIGISEENLEKIFEPFYMVDTSRSKSINGLGLGLSICQQIIDLLGFSFEIESKVNVGTTIKLKFRKEGNK